MKSVTISCSQAPMLLFASLPHSHLAAGKEVIFLAVGDTRDHRRATKDPALKDIAVEFVGNCVANLHMLGLDNYLVLASSKQLCDKLHTEYDVRACVWSSLHAQHPGLAAWRVNPGDMFHLWLQQWHYILRAVELGYNVLRSDSDVYFTEVRNPSNSGSPRVWIAVGYTVSRPADARRRALVGAEPSILEEGSSLECVQQLKSWGKLHTLHELYVT
jgi:hypothetical protein